MRRTAIVLVLSALAQPVRAQLTEVQPGARVRVQAAGLVAGHFVGTVLQRGADTIRIAAPNAMPIDVPLSRISSFEISRGNSRALGAGVGTLWGGAIGLAFGLLTAAATSQADNSYVPVASGEYVTASTLGGMLWGAGIGALIGRERWEEFDLHARSTMTLLPSRGGVTVSIAFRGR